MSIRISAVKDYRFRVFRKKAVCEALNVEQEQTFNLLLTQAEFEDYEGLKTKVHAQIEALGIPSSEAPYWREDPPVDAAFLAQLKAAIGAPDDVQFIAYYAHSYQHRHYKTVRVNGEDFRYMGFQNGHFIKFALDLPKAV